MILVGIIGIVMLIGIVYTKAQTTAIQQPISLENPFLDELPEWAEEPIVTLAHQGVITGMGGNEFHPGDPLTRGQLVFFIYRDLLSLGFLSTPNPGECQYFEDVPTGNELFLATCTFRRQGWLNSATHFRQDDPITRGEAAALFSRVFGKSLLYALGTSPLQVLSRGQVFEDVPTTHHFFIDTSLVHRLGIMIGSTDGNFGVNDPINRAAGALVIDRINGRLEEFDVQELVGFDEELHRGGVERTQESGII